MSTLHAGIPDVIIHNETGLLSKERDIESMFKHMLWLIAHKEAAKEMGAKGKARIKAHYTLSRHLDGLQRIIEHVVAQTV